jgi:hypothetical protein
VHLEGAHLSEAHLAGADLRLAFMDAATALNDVVLADDTHGAAQVADVRWWGVNLSVVDWAALHELGDERAARRWMGTRAARLASYRAAVRANRQLAVALQDQGLNEEAARFAFRAQHLQRQVFRLRRQVGAYLFSLLLAGLAGYGYLLHRILVAYVLVVGLFAAGYLGAGLAAGDMHWGAPAVLNAVQISLNAIHLNAIHGRVFFAKFSLDTAQSWLATGESLVGIVIEGMFVAMLIQRFFSR